MDSLVEDGGENIFKHDRNGWTALHHASKGGHAHLVLKILQTACIMFDEKNYDDGEKRLKDFVLKTDTLVSPPLAHRAQLMLRPALVGVLHLCVVMV